MIQAISHFHFPSLSFNGAGFALLPRGILPLTAPYDGIDPQKSRQNLKGQSL